jgi:SAM-dependent methyltransferase
VNPTLLPFLSCVACRRQELTLTATEYSPREIRHGDVRCGGCGAGYPILSGVLQAVGNGRESIRREQRAIREIVIGHERPPSICDDAWLLSLPYPTTMGTNRHVLEMMLRDGRNFETFVEPNISKIGPRVLDLGAGTCWSTARLAGRGLDCVAVDIALEKYAGLESADVLIEHGGWFFERVQADMSRLPFVDGTFDGVVACAALHHAEELQEVLLECSRVLTPGGTLLLSNEPNRRLFARGYKGQAADRAKGFNEHTYNILTWIKALRRAGFWPTLVMPTAIEERLATGASLRAANRAVAALWRRLPAKLRSWSLRVAYYPAAVLVGADFNIVARKLRR